MAYTNAIFYLDYELGSDTARTALTGCTASNPAGSTTRINKTGHGLITGAVVTLSAFSSWLNTTWKITKVDNDNFDLDTAVWQSTPDASGTVTPFGGQSWADAWKTFTNGATSTRIKSGDIIRVAQSPVPYSIGNATWNNLSKTVTLATAQTKTVALCESNWTASSNVTCTTSSTRKQGTYSQSIAIGASFTTGLAAYYALGSAQDFSAYQRLTFWIQNNAAVTANYLKVCLCSDTAGASIVDTFFIPAIGSTGRWLPLTITKNGGGNCGASIQSVAVYADTDPGTVTLLIDNIEACTTSGLSLQSLISKNTLVQSTVSSTNYGNEAWYGIQSISGTTILLDNETATAANAGRGYYGTTETVATYARETIKTTLATSVTTAVQTTTNSGSFANGNIQYQGGWDTATTLQTGETFFDGLNGNGYGISTSSTNYITLNLINPIRYNYGINYGGSKHTIQTISNCNNNTYAGINLSSAYSCIIENVINANNNGNYGIVFNGIADINISNIYNSNNNINYGMTIANCTTLLIDSIISRNNGNYGCVFAAVTNCIINNFTTSNNVSGSLTSNGGAIFYIRNATIGETTKFSSSVIYSNSRVNINNIGGYSEIWMYGANIVSQAATAGGTGIEWKITLTDNVRVADYPVILSIAKIACNANEQRTVTCYFKKSHATNNGAKLICKGKQIAGVASDVETTCPTDTNRNQVQIQFTPTEAGVVEIVVSVYAINLTASGNVIIDDITIS